MAATLPVAFDARGDTRPGSSSGTLARQRTNASYAGRRARLVLFGVLWGIVITGMEIPSMPFTTSAARPLSMLLLYQSLQWSWGGLMLSLALWWSTRGEVRWLRLAALLLLVAFFNGAAFVVWPLLVRIFGYGAIDPLPGQPTPLDSIFLYVAWLTLIYGGFAALIYALRRRIDQTTAALQGLTLARERNEAALAEARVCALVERIEPRFLLEVMDTARRQYLAQAERAEATLNACTEFLRSAMPQLRSGRSTVAAELDLVAAYLALRDCMACRDRDWRIDRRAASSCDSGPVDLDEVPLPPMALLPILERLLAAPVDSRGGDPLAIDVSVDDASVGIRITAATAAKPSAAVSADVSDADRLAALSIRLARVCGKDASLRSEGDGSARRTLVIVVPRRIDPQ